jgi:hypothetical protein
LTLRIVSIANTVCTGLQSLEASRLGAHEHPPAHQPAMAVVEGVEDRFDAGPSGQTRVLDMLLHGGKGGRVIGLQPEEICLARIRWAISF